MRRSSIAILIAGIGIAGSSSIALAAETPPAPAEQPVAIPTFVDETAASGIDSVYKGDWQYMVGGGAATLDCNGDGFPDLFLAGGENSAKFYRNASTRGGPLKFEEQKSGLELDAVTGAYPLDVDGDDMTDLILLRVGENIAMRGLGDCKFERANEAWGFDGGDGWSTAFAATFEKGNAWPTLAVGNYIDRTQDISPWGSCTDNWLHRPAASERKFAPPLPLKPSFCPLSMLFTDWNRSGTPSLRVSNDREYYEGGQEQMWKIEPGKPPALYTADEGWRLIRIWGMGIASYDLNGDGYPDYFLTSMADSRLQMLSSVPADGSKPKPSYAESALAKGVTAHRPYAGGDLRPSTGWHTQFADVNNDGRVDLFIAKGNVDEMPDFAAKDPNNLMLQGKDGKFQDVGEQAGIVNFKNSRGGAIVDFNLDGLLDIVAVHRRENVSLFRNISTNAGKWIELQINALGPNRRAIGGWLEVRCDDQTTLRREITVGGGHVSGQDGWWHFGIGDMPTVDVRVVWPDGTADAWQTVATDNLYVLAPGKPAERWAAR
jgi:hypothetical protein